MSGLGAPSRHRASYNRPRVISCADCRTEQVGFQAPFELAVSDRLGAGAKPHCQIVGGGNPRGQDAEWVRSAAGFRTTRPHGAVFGGHHMHWGGEIVRRRRRGAGVGSKLTGARPTQLHGLRSNRNHKGRCKSIPF
jgi:hypothetical protein